MDKQIPEKDIKNIVCRTDLVQQEYTYVSEKLDMQQGNHTTKMISSILYLIALIH